MLLITTPTQHITVIADLAVIVIVHMNETSESPKVSLQTSSEIIFKEMVWGDTG